MANNDLQDVFQFMAIRAGEKLDKLKARKNFIRDEAYYSREGSQINYSLRDLGADATNPLNSLNGIYDVDLFSSQSISPVGKLVYKHLIENNPKSMTGNLRKRIKAKGKVSGPKSVEDKVEELLIGGFEYDAFSNYSATPVIRTLRLDKSLSQVDGFLLSYSSEKNTYKKGNSLLIFPDSLTDIYTPLTIDLASALKAAEDYVATVKDDQEFKFESDEFVKLLKANITATAGSLVGMVFNVQAGRYNADFLLSKRILFDALYGLYILRKRYTLSLEPAINGLRAIHLLEAAAITEFFHDAIEQKAYPNNSAKFVSVLSSMCPLLAKWKPDSSKAIDELKSTGLSLIDSLDDVVEYVQASPIVNPIFARFNNAFEPFNSIKPIGIGDLKVVKQEFLGYRKGEIAHIETVLAGETKVRVHRVLEKSEDSFTYSSSNDSENTKDSQSTSRFELKNEVDQAIKTDLGINANTSFTYKGSPVIDASINAGMTFANSTTSSDKSSQNFVNEVISKATSRIQTKVSQQRSEVRLSEIEETNTHTFANSQPPLKHISGMYQWVEKVYRAQIHNFGKRLMFEFMLPEPAQYYVESKLYAYAASMDLPRYPSDTEASVSDTKYEAIPVASHLEITEDMYNNVLSKKWSLADLPPPPLLIENIPVVNGKPGQNGTAFTKSRAFNDTGWLSEGYSNCSISNLYPEYYLSALKVEGEIKFAMRDEDKAVNPNTNFINSLQIYINSNLVFDKVDERLMYWNLNETSSLPLPDLQSEKFDIDIKTKTCTSHNLKFYLAFQRSAGLFESWQKKVFEKIKNNPIKASSSLPTAEESKKTMLNEYVKKLRDIKPDAVNEIIRGKSGLWNQETIAVELKRQCISMVAKEFDSIIDDDVTKEPSTKLEELDVYFPALQIRPGKESTNANVKTIVEAKAEFDDVKDDPLTKFTLLDIEKAREKGRYIQFLEQAFEWNQLSYVFYPYFWASRPKWVELMSREDEADTLFTRFLQAGSSKVLLAVKPGYENAVLHFLATREPWEGGPSPVIGDPLYVPLYEEVRSQQDNLAGSTPVGKSWEFTLPTSLIYLESKEFPLVNPYVDKKPT